MERNSFMESRQKCSFSLVYLSIYLQHSGHSADYLHFWFQQEKRIAERLDYSNSFLDKATRVVAAIPRKETRRSC
jgi:hypothetical protein